MKRFLEMRGADGGRWRRICALPALWTGLLYDQTSLDAAWDLVKDWTRRGAPGAARRGAEDGAAHALPPHDRAGAGAPGAGDRPGRPAAARLRQRQGRGRAHLPRAGRGDPARRAARRPRRSCCATSATGAAAPIRCSATTPSERALREHLRCVPQPSRHRRREILSVARGPSCRSSAEGGKHSPSC